MRAPHHPKAPPTAGTRKGRLQPGQSQAALKPTYATQRGQVIVKPSPTPAGSARWRGKQGNSDSKRGQQQPDILGLGSHRGTKTRAQVCKAPGTQRVPWRRFLAPNMQRPCEHLGEKSHNRWCVTYFSHQGSPAISFSGTARPGLRRVCLHGALSLDS